MQHNTYTSEVGTEHESNLGGSSYHSDLTTEL